MSVKDSNTSVLRSLLLLVSAIAVSIDAAEVIQDGCSGYVNSPHPYSIAKVYSSPRSCLSSYSGAGCPCAITDLYNVYYPPDLLSGGRPDGLISQCSIIYEAGNASPCESNYVPSEDEPNLEITEFDVIHQFVPLNASAAEVVLVPGERAVAEVVVNGRNFDDPETTTTVTIQIGGKTYESSKIRLGDIEDSPSKVLIPIAIDDYGPEGAIYINATIDFSNKIAASYNKTKNVYAAVRRPNTLTILATRLTGYCAMIPDLFCSEEISGSRYSSLLATQVGYARLLYPSEIDIIDAAFNPIKLPPNLFTLETARSNLALAYVNKAMMETKKINANVSRVLVVANNSFMSIFGKGNVAGFAWPGGGMIISESQTNVGILAHELGHTLGLLHPCECPKDIRWPCPPQCPVKNLEEGFDETKNRLQGDPDSYVVKSGIDVTRTSPYDLMNAGILKPENYWFSKVDYLSLLDTLTQTEVDPPIIIVGAILSRVGELQGIEVFLEDDGFLTPSEPGPLKFEVLDQHGAVLASLTIAPSYQYWALPDPSVETASDSSGLLTSDYAPVVVALPAHANATKIIVTMEGKFLADIAIPDELPDGLSIPIIKAAMDKSKD